MKDKSVVEVKIVCGRCSNSTIQQVVLDKFEMSQEIFWVCTNCGAKKTVTVKKAEPEKEMPEQEPETTRYKMDGLGRKIALDDMGNREESKFSISKMGKNREKVILHGTSAERI